MMYLFSHLKVGHVFYKVAKEFDTKISLDYGSFMYGNIKPDVTKLCLMKHQLSDTILIYDTYKKRSKDDSLTVKERSEALGVACHYICDYFTKYHGREPYNSNNLFSHFLYEIKLHICLLIQLMCGGVKSQLKESFTPVKRIGTMIPRSILDVFGPYMGDLVEQYYNYDETATTDVHFILTGVNQLLVDVLVDSPMTVASHGTADLYTNHIA